MLRRPKLFLVEWGYKYNGWSSALHNWLYRLLGELSEDVVMVDGIVDMVDIFLFFDLLGWKSCKEYICLTLRSVIFRHAEGNL
jgi:hypothetical protein